jgi:hypothetical protein
MVSSYSLPLHEYCWVYKIKRQVNGGVERYKTYLVARGFTQ